MRLRNTAVHQGLNLLYQVGDIESHSVSDDAGGVLVKYTGGQKMKGKFSVIIDNGVPCIAASLKTDDNIRLFGKHVRYLSLALVSPVGAYNCSNHM